MFLERGFAFDKLPYLDFIKCDIVPFIKEHHSDSVILSFGLIMLVNIVVNYFEQKISSMSNI